MLFVRLKPKLTNCPLHSWAAISNHNSTMTPPPPQSLFPLSSLLLWKSSPRSVFSQSAVVWNVKQAELGRLWDSAVGAKQHGCALWGRKTNRAPRHRRLTRFYRELVRVTPAWAAAGSPENGATVNPSSGRKNPSGVDICSANRSTDSSSRITSYSLLFLSLSTRWLWVLPSPFHPGRNRD